MKRRYPKLKITDSTVYGTYKKHDISISPMYDTLSQKPIKNEYYVTIKGEDGSYAYSGSIIGNDIKKVLEKALKDSCL